MKKHPRQREPRPRRRLVALLVLAVAFTYLPVVGAGFVWDDAGHLTPPDLRGASGLVRIWLEPGATQQHYPLVHTLFWLEHALWGDAPLGYHLVNVGLHATAALLVARLLARLSIPGAWLAAFAFALHPSQAESVAWISEQKNTLSACFYLAAWCAWTRFDERLVAGERPAWGAWGASLVLAVAAALSKTVTATLVPAILLVTWWREGGTAWLGRVRWLVPHLAVAAGLALVTPWLEREVGGARGAPWALEPLERVVVAGKDLWFYLAKLAWPWSPSFVYPRFATTVSPAGLAPALGFAAALALAFALRGRIGRAPFAALAFFAGTLFPALGFFDAVPFRYSFVADHFQYTACLGPLVLVAAGVARWHARLDSTLPRAASSVLVLGLGAAWAVRAHVHARDFRSSEALWGATLEANPAAWLARENLMHELVRAGRAEEALALGEQGLALHPDRAALRTNLGVALQAAGRPDAALARFEEALALDPSSTRAAVDRASALSALGRDAEALAALDDALAREPGLVVAHMLRGNALLALGRTDEAVRALEQGLALDPSHAQSWFNLGVARERRGELDAARAAYARAAELDPGDLGARFNLGLVLARQGRAAEARRELEHVARAAAGGPLGARAVRALELLGAPGGGR